MGAVMVPAGDIILLHGGYRSNYQYESLWLFDTNLGTWREKMDFVHALYPKNCKYIFPFYYHNMNQGIYYMLLTFIENNIFFFIFFLFFFDNERYG